MLRQILLNKSEILASRNLQNYIDVTLEQQYSFMLGLTTRIKTTQELIACAICFCVVTFVAAADDSLSENHKLLIQELVSLSGEMRDFEQSVKDYYHEFIFIHVDQMFIGTILENDPNAILTIRKAIDDAVEWEFTEGAGLERVHYLSFGSDNSEQELEEIVALYKTPIGKKILNSNAGVFKEWATNRNIWAKSLHSTIRRKAKVRLEKYYERKLKEIASKK